MDRQVDSHQWASKTETQCRLSRKRDLEFEVEPDTQTTAEKSTKAHLPRRGPARSIGVFLKSRIASIQRILSRRAQCKNWYCSAESSAVRRFTSQLSCDLSRFKA
jgi:hypothetical protein